MMRTTPSDSSSREPKAISLRRWAAIALAAVLMLGATASVASADRHDSSMAGHPLRIIAYVVHPVGVILDYLLFRPAHWLASHEPIRTLVGHED